MFLKFLKNFILKRKLKNSLLNVNNSSSADKITTVGILTDESYFKDREGLVQELVDNGIRPENIKILIYKDKIKKNEEFAHPVFNLNTINWEGIVTKEEVKEFMGMNFDMLISYYDIEKAALLLVTQQTKANFKVGFSTIDKRLNNFMINTIAENYNVFSNELFRYLKILNKI